MTSPTQLPAMPVPSDDEFRAQALRYLPVCVAHCQCPDRWHTLWMGLKTTGLLRGVYLQAPLLRTMLAPYWVPGGHVLIAGAADTGLLEVLSGLYGDRQARYTVVDLCKAPLEMVSEYAAEAGLNVRPALTNLVDLPSDESWDLVFIHYTLSFLDAPARAAFLRRLKAGLSPKGVALCAIRFQDPPASTKDDVDQARTQQWLESSRTQLREAFGSDPTLIHPLLQWLPAYAQSRQERERSMPHVDVMREEFRQAGLEILAASDPMWPTSARTDLSMPSVIKNQIFVLR